MHSSTILGFSDTFDKTILLYYSLLSTDLTLCTRQSYLLHKNRTK